MVLLLIFFLFGSNFVLKSGVSVELPSSASALPAAPQAHIITITSGETDQIFFNERQVDLAELKGLLIESRERSDQVILLGDELISYGKVMEVSQLVMSHGYHLSFATREKAP